jgi:hypothetical protein
MAKSANRWVPNQYGSYSMVLAPPIAGGFIGGWEPPHVALSIAWLAAFCGYSAWRTMLTARDRKPFYAPIGVYAGLALWFGLLALIAVPWLIWWAPILALVGIGTAIANIRRLEHTIIGNALPMIFACLMTPIAAGPGFAYRGDFETIPFWPPVGSDHREVWLGAAVMFLYFFGTVLYVKTMIRERGKPAWYWSSVGYHGAFVLVSVLIVVAGWAPGAATWLLPVAAAITLARAALVPRLFPKVKPVQYGAPEFLVTALITAACALAFA